LADIIVDIAQNACESGAGLVELELRETGGEFQFTVRDNGKGMTPEELSGAIDPFVTDGVKHPHRKVGLGLPFLLQAAEQSGGGWNLDSEKGRGTAVTAWFDAGNIDTPPEGDVPDMFRIVFMFDGPEEIVVRRFRDSGGKPPLDYEVRKSELADALGGLDDAGALVLLGKYLRSLEEDAPSEDGA